MDGNQIEDKVSENIHKSASQSIKRLTPGKFSESSDYESNSIISSKSYEEPKEDTFFIYSGNMDANSIWNSNTDYKNSVSVQSSSLTTNQDSLNSIWSSKYNMNDSLKKQDEQCQIPHISIDINEFELTENTMNSVLNESNDSKSDLKENFSVEDRKKISSMINSHDGWGVKPINQNTPWVFPEGELDTNNYPDTFSTWLNDTSNGAYAWEASKKQNQQDWSSNMKSKTYGITGKSSIISNGTTESIWSQSNVYSNCAAVGSNNLKPKVIPGFSTPDQNNGNYLTNVARTDRPIQDHGNTSCWNADFALRQMGDFKLMQNSIQGDRFTNQRPKLNADNEIQAYKHYKELDKQITELFQKEERKIQEIDNNLSNLNKLPDSQFRIIFNELLRQRLATQQRMQALRPQHEALVQKLKSLEDILLTFQRTSRGSSSTVDKQFMRLEMTNPSVTGIDLLTNKLSSMQVQSTQDFRLDVPEFIPGKKWHGISQNGKENRNPTVYNKLAACSQYSENCNESNPDAGSSYSLIWLFIQNLPSHVTMEMIQNFFIQNNNPCVMPIHSNPFSRWMLVRFPNPFCSQKALQLLSGKIGQTTLISDQDANIKLQELKGAMAKFVAHQN